MSLIESRFVEVSHTIEAGMKTYPGLPVPESEILVDYDTSRANATTANPSS